MRLNINVDESTGTKIKHALKDSFKTRNEHLAREALRNSANFSDEDRDFSTAMHTVQMYGTPMASAAVAAMASVATHAEAASYEKLLHDSKTVKGEATVTQEVTSGTTSMQSTQTTPAHMEKIDAGTTSSATTTPVHMNSAKMSMSSVQTPGGVSPHSLSAVADMYKHVASQTQSGGMFSDSGSTGNGVATYRTISNYEIARKEIDSVANGARYASEFSNIKPYGTSHIDISRDPLMTGPGVAHVHFNGNEGAQISGFHVTEMSEHPLSLNVGVEERVFIANNGPGYTYFRTSQAPVTGDYLMSRGWDRVLATDANTKQVIGYVYTHRVGTTFNNAGQVSSNNQIYKQWMKAKGIHMHTSSRKLTDTERLVRDLAQKNAKVGRYIRTNKLAMRSLRMSLTNIVMKDMRNSEFGKGLNVAQKSMMVTRTIGSPIGRLAKRQVIKKLNAAVYKKMQLNLAAKKVGMTNAKMLKALAPDRYREVLKAITKDVLKQNSNGLFANWVYEKTMGTLNAGIQKLTQGIIKNSTGIVNTLAQRAGGLSKGIYDAHGIRGFKEMQKAKLKQKAKDALKKKGKAVLRKTMRWNPGNRFVRFVYLKTKRIKNFAKSIKVAFAALKEMIRTLLMFLAKFIIIVLILMMMIQGIMCILSAVANVLSGYTGYTTVSDADNEATPNYEQLDVSELTAELHDMHTSFAKEIKDAISSNDADAEPVYDNGSKENYKECISALTIMTNYNYGIAGKTITKKDLQSVYDKTHSYTVVPTERKGTRSTGKKDKKGNLIYEDYTYMKNVIHVQIIRDEAVVNQEMYYQVEGGGSCNIPEPEDISNSNWVECIQNTKQLFASKIGYYQLGGYKAISYKGKSYTPRTDCSGYVSACLYFYGMTSRIDAYTSDSLKNNVPGFTKYAWNGSTSKLQVGDILVYSGHTEIWAGNGQVYNYGSNRSASNPGATKWGNHEGKVCIQRMKKSELTRNQDQVASKDKSKDTNLNIKTDKNKSGISTDKNEPTLIGTKYYDAAVPANPNYKGNKTYMSYKAITSKTSRQYILQQRSQMTSDHDNYRRFGDRYVIALGSGVLGQNVSNDKHYQLIGQYVDLILENGTVIKCIVGDAKSNAHTDLETHFFTCRDASNPNYTPSWCCSEFVTDGIPKQAPNRHANGWDSKVAIIRIYDKNVLGNSAYTGTSAEGSGYSKEIEYNKDGNEVGGVAAIAETFKKYQEKYNNGEFNLKYKKKKSKHVIKNGAKTTSFDYLRFIYAKHGVTLPITVDAIPGNYDEPKSVGRGDILLYKREPDEGVDDANIVAFSYVGDGKVSGFVGKNFTDKNGTVYPDNSIVTIDKSLLANKNKEGWYDVKGILIDEAFGASPSTGFGGWSDEYVVLYNSVRTKEGMWIENSTQNLYQENYTGYYEDDFTSDVTVSVSNVDKQNFLSSIKRASMYAYNQYGILPSLYAALACDTSNYGNSILSSAYANPLHLKWHKGCHWQTVNNPHASSASSRNTTYLYIDCYNYQDNVDAWVEEMEASARGTLMVENLKKIASGDENELNDGISGLYELEAKFYYRGSSEERVEHLVKIIESNKLYNWDQEAKGN